MKHVNSLKEPPYHINIKDMMIETCKQENFLETVTPNNLDQFILIWQEVKILKKRTSCPDLVRYFFVWKHFKNWITSYLNQ